MKLTEITDPALLAKLHAKEGPQGPMGPMGPQGPVGPTGKQGPKGEKGDRGADGVGISRTWIDKDGSFMVEYTNGTQVNVGSIRTNTVDDLVTKGNAVFGGGGGLSRQQVINLINETTGGLTTPEDAGTIEHFTFVSSLSDLPTPDAGVITLNSNHTYYFLGTVDLNGNRMVGQFNTCILGPSSENAFITSTGLANGTALFTSSWTTPIRHVTFKDVDTCFDFDGTSNPGSLALDWTGVNFVNIPNVGTFYNFDNFIFTKGAFLSSQGMVVDGSFNTFSIADSLLQGTGSAGSIISLPATAVVGRRFRIIYSSVIAFGSTVGISVNASATIPSTSFIMDTVNFGGGSTYISGLNFQDNESLFVNNVGIVNSREVSQYYMNANTTATSIASSGVAYKVAGTTTSGALTSKFTNTDNRATYTGAVSKIFTATATLSLSSGTNDIIGTYFALNGTVIPESEVYTTTDTNGDLLNVTIQTLVQLGTNDYVEVFVENDSAAVDITVDTLNVIIQ